MRKNSYGFTIMEVLITLGLLSILTTIALNLFRETVFNAEKANNLLELEGNGNTVLQLFESKLRAADKITAFDTDPAWIFFTPKSPTPTSACTYISSQGVGQGLLANGYIFMQEGTSAQCQALTVSSLDGDPLDEETLGPVQILTNRNVDDPYNGVNVTAFDLQVDNTTGTNPPTVKINIFMAQGVSGSGTEPIASKRASIQFQTTVSLR